VNNRFVGCMFYGSSHNSFNFEVGHFVGSPYPHYMKRYGANINR
jgi:hypothetical protein